MLAEHLSSLIKGKLSDLEYPAMDDVINREKPSDIIVFIIGGATYEEAVTLKEVKDSPEFSNVRIVLGGTTILNSQAYLKELRRLHESSMKR